MKIILAVLTICLSQSSFSQPSVFDTQYYQIGLTREHGKLILSNANHNIPELIKSLREDAANCQASSGVSESIDKLQSEYSSLRQKFSNYLEETVASSYTCKGMSDLVSQANCVIDMIHTIPGNVFKYIGQIEDANRSVLKVRLSINC